MKHVIEINRFVKDNLLVIFIVLVFVTEGYSKILNITTGNNSEIPKAIKGIILAYMLSMIAFQNFNSKYIKYILLLSCCFLIGQYSISGEFLFCKHISVF